MVVVIATSSNKKVLNLFMWQPICFPVLSQAHSSCAYDLSYLVVLYKHRCCDLIMTRTTKCYCWQPPTPPTIASLIRILCNTDNIMLNIYINNAISCFYAIVEIIGNFIHFSLSSSSLLSLSLFLSPLCGTTRSCNSSHKHTIVDGIVPSSAASSLLCLVFFFFLWKLL